MDGLSLLWRKLMMLIADLLRLPLYWMSFLTPRSQNIWVFGAWQGQRYADNSRYLFEYVCAHQPHVRAIWLTHKESIVKKMRACDREAYLINSLRGYWFSCRAGLVVVCTGGADVNRVGISRAKGIQLWHGVPIKKILLDDKISDPHRFSRLYQFARKVRRALFPFTYTMRKWSVIISTSQFVSKRLMSAYGVDDTRVVVTGYPRNDVLFAPDPHPPSPPIVDEIVRAWNAPRIICYVPTHRGEGKRGMEVLFAEFEVDEMEGLLEKHRAVLLIKTHYFHRDERPLLDIDAGKTRIYWLKEDESIDLNALMPFINVLITDYSSAYIDFLLLNRPIIFAPFDLEEYRAQDREFYEDYEMVVPGALCRSWHEVIVELGRVLAGDDQYREKRLEARRKYHAFVDGESSRRVYELAFNLVGRERGEGRAGR